MAWPEGFYIVWKVADRLHDAFALGAFTGQLTRTANSFSLLACLLLRRLFKVIPGFHFPEKAFALHFFLQRPQGLINVIIAHNDLYYG